MNQVPMRSGPPGVGLGREGEEGGGCGGTWNGELALQGGEESCG